MSVTRFVLLAVTLLPIGVATAQLKIGDGGIVGYHSDIRARDWYYTAGLGGGYLGTNSTQSFVVSLTGGVGRTVRLSEQFHVGGEVRLGYGQGYSRRGDTRFRTVGSAAVSGTLLATAFLTTGKRGRSWLKVGLPLVSNRPNYSYGDGVQQYLGRSASLAWVYYFRRDPDYVRAAAVRGPSRLRGFSVDMRAGNVYLATALAPRINYTLGRWELGLGTILHAGEAGGFDGLRLGRDYFPVTVSGGYTLRQTEATRFQLLAEVMAPLRDRDRDEFFRAYGSLYGRYEHSLGKHLAAAIEFGPNYMLNRRTERSGTSFSSVNVFFHGTVGVRYAL